MFTDPLAVTYDGSAKSLPRVAAGTNGTIYRTADSEFEVRISNVAPKSRNPSGKLAFVSLGRRVTDPTPANVFDNFREVYNIFGCYYDFDPVTRAEVSVDIPRLRTALLALVDSTFQGRVIAGEK